MSFFSPTCLFVQPTTFITGILQSQDESTTGSINTSRYERALLALRSHAFNISNPQFKGNLCNQDRIIGCLIYIGRQERCILMIPNLCLHFVEIFPELVAVQQVPLHIAFPNAPVVEAPPVTTTAPALPTGAIQRRTVDGQRGAAGAAGGQAVLAGAGAHGTNGVGANGAAGAAAARRPSLFSMSHWHKWLAFFLVFAYLVIAKTITRATAASSSAASSLH